MRENIIFYFTDQQRADTCGFHNAPGWFDCSVINPIITKNSTNLNIRKLHNDKFDSKKAAKVGLDASLKTSIVPDDDIIDLRNQVRADDQWTESWLKPLYDTGRYYVRDHDRAFICKPFHAAAGKISDETVC